MDKIDQLFVRACKSEGNEIKKIEKLYKRFYLNRENVECFVAGLLAAVCDLPVLLAARFSAVYACWSLRCSSASTMGGSVRMNAS